MTATSEPSSPAEPFDDGLAAARLARRVVAQWPLILACALLAAGAAYLGSKSRTKQYEATSIMQVGSVDLVSLFLSQDIQIQDTNPARQTAGSVEIFNLPNVRDRAVKELGPAYTAEQIGASIRVVASTDSNVLRVIARDASPDRARSMSVAMTDAFVAQRIATARRSLVQAKKQVRRQYDGLSAADKRSPTGLELRDRLRQVGVVGSLSNGNVEIIQKARVPSTPVSPRPRRDAILALLAGLLIGLVIAVLRARLDDRVRDTTELSEIWELPVVGLVPQTDGLRKAARLLPDGPALEALSLARTNLRYLHVGGTVKTVLVTSALSGEGKSTMTVNLALAASLAKSRVLVIEADLRRPTITSRLGLTDAGNGLSEVLAGIAPLESAIREVTVQSADERTVATIDLLPAGLVPPSPVALLEGAETASMLRTLRGRYDIILIDTPPAIVVADALAIVDAVDGVLVVSRLGTVSRTALIRLRDTLTGVQAPVLGQIVNSGGDDTAYSYYTSPAKTKRRFRLPRKRPASSPAG